MTYTIYLREVSISGTVTNTQIYPEIGFSIIEKLNEELDIGAMELKFTEKATPYGMFDTIRILIDSSLVYSMRIGGDTVTLASKKPLLYDHTLSLVEHTKILERVVISGKTFTQPIDITATKLTLFDVVNTLRLVYPLEVNDNSATTRIFSIPSALETYLDAIESPEFTFKDITLREALNQVFDYVDGIARLDEDGVLSIDFFNELVDLINDETGNYNKSAQQDIEFHGTDITVDALNMVNDNDESEAIEVYPAKGAYTTARCDQYIFDFTKSYIPTSKPIYSINKLGIRADFVMRATISGTDYTIEIDSVDVDGWHDIFAYSYEKNGTAPRLLEFDKYKIQPADQENVGEKYTSGFYLQSNTIYYNYGERNITQNGTTGIWDTITSISIMLNILTYEWLLENNALATDPSSTPISSLNQDDINIVISTSQDDYMYQAYYTPIPKSIRFNIDRQDLTDVYKKTTLMTNQQSRIINVSNFLDNVKGKINKIGNSEMQLANRVNALTDIYSVNDYTDENYIVTSKEIVFYNDFFDCSYELSRNWNKLSQFIGVNSEIRQWEIGESGRTLERDLLYKEFIEIDVVESGSGSTTSEFFTAVGFRTYLNTFDSSASSDILPVAVGMMDGLEGATAIGPVLSPISSNGGGNSLLFRFQFNHNKDAGNYRDTINFYVANQFEPYAHEDGTLDKLAINLFDSMVSTTDANYAIRAELFPQTDVTHGDNSLLHNGDYIDVYKDNREILTFMLQVQNISLDVNKVILGRALSTRNGLVNELKPTTVYLQTYTTGSFGKNDDLTAPSGGTKVTPTIVVSNITKNAIVSHANLTSSVSRWCLTDENDKILIAVNQSGTLLDTITFDFKNKRSTINYNFD